MAENLAEQSRQSKIEAFNADLRALQDKHGLVIVPEIAVNNHGILPTLGVMDRDEFLARTQGPVQTKTTN